MRRLLTCRILPCDRRNSAGGAFARARPERRPGGAQAGRARLHAGRPADVPPAAEVQERVPRDASVHAPAGRRRLRRPRRGSVRDRLRRADRARVPLRHHPERADRHPPDERPDDRVLRPVQCPASGQRVPPRRLGSLHDRRHQQLQGQLFARTRRDRVAELRDRRGRLCRADLGEQLEPSAPGAHRPQRHVPDRSGRACPHPADRVRRRRVASRGPDTSRA